jgi:hypothetical protein
MCDDLTGVLLCEPPGFRRKGIILPKDIRTSRAWEPGTEFTIEETREGLLLRPCGRFPKWISQTSRVFCNLIVSPQREGTCAMPLSAK